MASHFEITVTSRQMALFVGAGVVLVLIAFGLGVAVGVQERLAAPPITPTPEPVAIHAEPSLRGAQEPRPSPTPLSAVEVAVAPEGRGPTAPRASPVTMPATLPAPAPTRAPVEAFSARSRVGPGYWVQIGAFSQPASADRARKQVLEAGYAAVQVVVELGDDGKYRVRIGPFPDEESAGRVAARLRIKGFPGAFTVSE